MMRCLGWLVLCLACALPVISGSAQDTKAVPTPPVVAEPGSNPSPLEPPPGATVLPPATQAPSASVPQVGAAAQVVATPAAPTAPTTSTTSSSVAYPAAPAPGSLKLSAPVLAPETKLAQSDAWVAFERERDIRTVRGEKVFFPLALLAQAGFGAALAVVADDVSTRTRTLLGVSGGLSAATLLPYLLSSSRDGKRAWFGVGSTAFAVALGASLISLEDDHKNREDDPSHGAQNWIGTAIAVQGLAMLPIGLMPGWPSDKDYEAYAMLPPEARPDAANRILLQIDRYEQRVTGAIILSNLLAMTILGVGAMVNDDKQERQAIGAVSLVPLATSLLIAVPRLFVASRNERFSLGQGPSRLGFNAW